MSQKEFFISPYEDTLNKAAFHGTFEKSSPYFAYRFNSPIFVESRIQMKKIVIITDSFKGCLSSYQVAESVAEGIHQVQPTCETLCLPISDGGEGLLEVMVESTKGTYIRTIVHDPLMRPLPAHYGILGDGETAVIEMAQASGLPLLSPEERNPMKTTSYGTGELILDALQKGYKKLLIGIGGSATNDAGMGMMQALGATFFNAKGEVLPIGCGGIVNEIHRIDLHSFYSLINEAHFTVACDVDNPFYGPQGASQIFAPQKGANAAEVAVLDQNLSIYAEEIKRTTQKDIGQLPGAGAAGGIGGALEAFFKADLTPGIDLVLNNIGFEKALNGANLVITGEGKADKQTLRGKVPYGVLQRAQAHQIPVVLLAGSVNDVESLNQAGFASVLSITQEPLTLKEAMQPETAAKNLRETAMQVVRLANVFNKKSDN